MELLNKTYAQIVDLFRSMTPGARLTAGLLLIVVVVSVGYLFTNQISGPTSDLMHGVPVQPSEIPGMQAAFAKKKLYGAEIRGTQIFVPRGQEAVYMAALAEDNALPPSFKTAMVKAVESSNPFMTSDDRKARLKLATQETLRLAFASMDGIEQGYVLYDSDVKSGLNREKIFTATAFVKPKGTDPLDEAKVSSIRKMVSGVIAGMKAENVNVTDLNSSKTWSGNPESGGNPGDNEYLALKKAYEDDLKSKIAQTLAYIPNTNIAVCMTLDPKKTTRTRTVLHDPTRSIPIRSSESKNSRSENTSGPAGRAGLVAQQPNMGATLSTKSGGSTDEEKNSKTETISIPSGEESDSTTLGLIPKLASVSIVIPSGYFKKIWQEANEGKDAKNADPAALTSIRKEVVEKVKKQVARLLPASENKPDLTELVEVTDFQELPMAVPPEPGLAKNALLWLGDSWGMIGMVVLVGVSLFMLRSLVRLSPVPPPESRAMPRLAPETVSHVDHETSEPEAAAQPRNRRFTTGPSLRDEISDLVKEDPNTAANILKTWIGQAG